MMRGGLYLFLYLVHRLSFARAYAKQIPEPASGGPSRLRASGERRSKATPLAGSCGGGGRRSPGFSPSCPCGEHAAASSSVMASRRHVRPRRETPHHGRGGAVCAASLQPRPGALPSTRRGLGVEGTSSRARPPPTAPRRSRPPARPPAGTARRKLRLPTPPAAEAGPAAAAQVSLPKAAPRRMEPPGGLEALQGPLRLLLGLLALCLALLLLLSWRLARPRGAARGRGQVPPASPQLLQVLPSGGAAAAAAPAPPRPGPGSRREPLGRGPPLGSQGSGSLAGLGRRPVLAPPNSPATTAGSRVSIGGGGGAASPSQGLCPGQGGLLCCARGESRPWLEGAALTTSGPRDESPPPATRCSISPALLPRIPPPALCLLFPSLGAPFSLRQVRGCLSVYRFTCPSPPRALQGGRKGCLVVLDPN